MSEEDVNINKLFSLEDRVSKLEKEIETLKSEINTLWEADKCHKRNSTMFSKELSKTNKEVAELKKEIETLKIYRNDDTTTICEIIKRIESLQQWKSNLYSRIGWIHRVDKKIECLEGYNEQLIANDQASTQLNDQSFEFSKQNREVLRELLDTFFDYIEGRSFSEDVMKRIERLQKQLSDAPTPTLLTYKDALEFQKKIRERCSHCKHYIYVDEDSYRCYESTDSFLCQLFTLKEPKEAEPFILKEILTQIPHNQSIDAQCRLITKAFNIGKEIGKKELAEELKVFIKEKSYNAYYKDGKPRTEVVASPLYVVSMKDLSEFIRDKLEGK